MPGFRGTVGALCRGGAVPRIGQHEIEVFS